MTLFPLIFRRLLPRWRIRPRGFRGAAGNSVHDCPVQTPFGAKTGAAKMQFLEQLLPVEIDRSDSHEVNNNRLGPTLTNREPPHQINQGLLGGARELSLYY